MLLVVDAALPMLRGGMRSLAATASCLQLAAAPPLPAAAAAAPALVPGAEPGRLELLLPGRGAPPTRAPAPTPVPLPSAALLTPAAVLTLVLVLALALLVMAPMLSVSPSVLLPLLPLAKKSVVNPVASTVMDTCAGVGKGGEIMRNSSEKQVLYNTDTQKNRRGERESRHIPLRPVFLFYLEISLIVHSCADVRHLYQIKKRSAKLSIVSPLRW